MSDCRIDILGTDEISRHLGKRDQRRAKVPTLVQTLELAARKGVGVNLEINNYPAGPTSTPARRRSSRSGSPQQIKQSGFPPDDLILQSFLPGNLKPFQDDPYFADRRDVLSDPAGLNAIAVPVAESSGFDWISPEWPVSPELISDAHAPGSRSSRSRSTSARR